MGGGFSGFSDFSGPRARTKLKPFETRAKLNERPNTVVIDGKGFAVLPSESELAHFINEAVLITDESKQLVTQIKSVYMDENKREYLIRMETSDSMTALADLMSNGIAWPGYTNEDGEEVIVRGYSMENPVIEITISGVGWWTSEQTVRSAVSAWGEVKEIKEGKLNVPGLPSFSHIKTDKWFVKLAKKKEVKIPGVVLHLGSERSGEEREMWKVWYKGVPKVCFKCFHDGHIMRDCKQEQVLADTMGNYLGIGEEADAAMELQEAGETATNQMKRTFAQVLKEENYKALRKEQEQKRKEKAAMASQQRKEQTTTKQKASVSAAKNQTFEENIDFYEGNKDLDSQEIQDKDEVINEQSMDGFSGDWAADSVKSPKDPLYRAQLQELDNSEEDENNNISVPHGKRAPSYTPVKPPPSKKTLTEDSSLNNSQVYPEYSDEDEDNFYGFSSSPPSSPLLEASPSKQSRQSESTTGQSVEEVNPTPPDPSGTEREIQVKFLPDNDCHD